MLGQDESSEHPAEIDPDADKRLLPPGEDDLEAAYQRALEAMEAAEWVEDGPSDSPDGDTVPEAVAGTSSPPAQPATHGVPVLAANTLPDVAASTPGTRRKSGRGSRAGDFRVGEAVSVEETPPSRLTPHGIIEAALFVGGAPLTAKRLCTLLGGSFESSFIEAAVDELNARYLRELRPYQILLGEGGYRLDLRSDFERIRNRVYGVGPKDVRLSQEALEVLALVAYQQPVTNETIEGCHLANAGNLVRQLVRRELVAVERGSSGPRTVMYRTTPRFLALFGLGSLEDLPKPDDVEVK